MQNKYLKAWYWVLSQGHVSIEECQAWAYAMIERMASPPAWICDMATSETKFELGQKMRDHLDPWSAEDLKVDHFELQVSLSYLTYRRGEIGLGQLLEMMSKQPNFRPPRGREAFESLRLKVLEGGATPELEAQAKALFADCLAAPALYFEMRHGPPDDMAREIEGAGG